MVCAGTALALAARTQYVAGAVLVGAEVGTSKLNVLLLVWFFQIIALGLTLRIVS